MISKAPPKKILFVITGLGMGGAERFLTRLLHDLNRECFTPVLATLEDLNDLSGSVPKDVRRICLHRKFAYLEFPLQVYKLSRLIRQERPDLVFALLEYPNVITPLACRLSGLKMPVAISERIAGRFELGEVWTGKMRFWLRKKVYPLADRIIAVSEGVADDLAESFRIPREKISAVHNGVDIQELLQMSRMPADLNIKAKYLILTAGRLEKQKGMSYLLHAFQKVLKEADAQLLILGDGSKRKNLEETAESLGISEKVTFYGKDSNPYRWFSKAHLFVLPSLYEGFPNVILEAMACGLPVVSTACPYGPQEIITQGLDGLLVPPADINALAGAMLKVLTDESLRRSLTVQAAERVQQFQLSEAVFRYEEIFKKLIQKSKA